MKCEKCGQCEATVHLTQMVSGEVRKLHLCAECANQNGIVSHIPSTISEILLGAGAKTSMASTKRAGGVCSTCGLKREQFQSMGRLGCDDCYTSFSEELSPIIRAMHHADHHVGKIPQSLIREIDLGKEMEALHGRLRDAVKSEHFEEAARLRDRISILSSELDALNRSAS